MALSSVTTSLRNTWRIACRSNAVEAKKPAKAQVFEQKIVLMRDKWGRVTALRDMDNVRGFPLSGGFANQRTRTIESYYDKYRYDSDGKLISVPSATTEGEEFDKTLRIPKYHIVEADGYIWVWMGKGKPVGEPLEIEGIGEYVWNQQTQWIEADPSLCLQHEMDWPSSLAQDRLYWAHRRSLIPLRKAMTLEQPYETRVTEQGFEIFQPPTESATSAKLRQARTSTFTLPDRVVHQKLLKRAFWRGFGDFMSIAHFIPEIDVLTGKIITRAEYMWTPLLLPGYAFQRNKLTTLSRHIPGSLPLYRKTDKAVLEEWQKNLNHWAAVEALQVSPSFVDIDAVRNGTVETENAAPSVDTSIVADSPVVSHSVATSSSVAVIGAAPAFGPEVAIDSPAAAVRNILQLGASETWTSDNAKVVIPNGRHVGKFRVTHSDS